MTKGFSLVEMLVAVVIIGILAFYGVTSYQVAADKARFETHRSLVEAVARAEHAYYYGAGEYTNDLSILAVHIPAEDPIHWKDVQTGESLPGFYTDKEESVFTAWKYRRTASSCCWWLPRLPQTTFRFNMLPC